MWFFKIHNSDEGGGGLDLPIYQIALFTLIVICIYRNYLNIRLIVLFLKSCSFPALQLFRIGIKTITL